MNEPNPLVAGSLCTINAAGDIAISGEARQFIGEICIIVKMTKAGLVCVWHFKEIRGRFAVFHLEIL